MTERLHVSMHEAQSQLAKLAERVWQGDAVVITKDGKPYLNLLPHVAAARAREPGRLKGKFESLRNLI
ncbi:type II toxin-antitoxin system Phd/YefM family antitoxin [Pseudomonas sp. PB3P13]